MRSHGIDLGVFVRLNDMLTRPLKDTEEKVARATERMNKRLKLSMKLGVAGGAAAGIAYSAKRITEGFTGSIREVERAKGELATLGVTNLDAVVKKGQEMQGKLAGVTAAAFVRASYDIKSGISTLTDDGVAEMTASAMMVAKATKGVPEQMTSLFATSYGIFKKQHQDMSDADFGNMFGAALAKSVQQFKTDGAKMQQAIESAGAGASNLGVTLTEQLAVLGMMQTQMQASEAGTALRAFATNAAKAEEKFQQLAQKSGNPIRVRILDDTGQLRVMPDILTDLKERYGDTLDAFEASEIKDAFGTDEAMKLINALYGQEAAVKANMHALEGAAGQGAAFTREMAKAADSNFDSAMILLGQKMDLLKQKIGARLAPVLERLTPKIDAVIEKLFSWVDANPRLVKGIGIAVMAIGGIAAVMAPVFLTASALVGAWGTLAFGAGKLAIAGAKLGSGLIWLGKVALPLVGKAALAIGRALMMNPIGLAVTVIAGGAYLIYRNWEPIAGFFTRIWNRVKSVFSWEGIKTALSFTPLGLIARNWEPIAGFFTRIWDRVKSVFSWESIKTALSFTPLGLIVQNWEPLSNFFSGLWARIGGAFSASWSAIRAGVLEWPRQIIGGLTEGIKARIEMVVETVTGLGSRIIGSFKSVLGIASPSRIFASFGGFLMEGLIGGLKERLAAVKETITGIGSNVVGWFKDKLGIRSPSRVFMGLGGHLGQGLALGIAGTKNDIFARMQAIRAELVRPLPALAVPAMALPAIAQAAIAPAALATGLAGQPSATAPELISGVPAHNMQVQSPRQVTYAPQTTITIQAGSVGQAEDIEALIRQALDERDAQMRSDMERNLHD